MLVRGQSAARRPATRWQAEVRLAALEKVFGMGEMLATTSVGLATRIAEKLIACAHRLYINRLLGRAQGLIKASWA